MFILSNERTSDNPECFGQYKAYLTQHKNIFPSKAYSLATSEWYGNFNDPRCPHDAWLENIKIEERNSGDRQENRYITITIRLLGAYHDGFIELIYPQVFNYQLNCNHGIQGHRDWRYDELRINDQGHLIHEIEWYDLNESSRWLIEASDIEYRWISKGEIT
ncbi:MULTISPECIES: hypothetical protein [unclassified Acinetobacter]|uniref:hypothetical protein n=1 Tax=unclassified Acinetobacter TaxID=196816 RepID=UPI0022AC48B3|nr:MULTISPECIES: hypothetical protein [unclassified Acinetobacter]WAU72229.1 hypothetical protein O1450_08725 [Acinetobacter sp. TR11]WAU77866.1 hypothetical protein O1449_06850 [Acinetobacter sp. TR3]